MTTPARRAVTGHDGEGRAIIGMPQLFAGSENTHVPP
jgi:hypothetical protein